MFRFILSQLHNHLKIMKYASPVLAQLLNFPGLFINHFCSISKITFPAKFELPHTCKIFLKLATVFSFATWHIFKTYLTFVAMSQRFDQACFSNWFSFYSSVWFPADSISANKLPKCEVSRSHSHAQMYPGSRSIKWLYGRALGSCGQQWYMIW